ncbi:hypothetical protein [Emticicia sp. 17c]|uniref:hypothetical protein n=1 Tax=Emticicia sp. 17c TaxID=3127704 RepID=UPI00301D177B
MNIILQRSIVCGLMAFGFVACQSINRKVAYTTSEITLTNGTVLKGSTSPIADNSFSFKDARTSKKSTIESKNVQSVIKHFPDGTREYLQFEVLGKNDKPQRILAAYAIKGDLNLLAYEVSKHSRKAQTVNNRQTFVEETILVKEFYLKKNDTAGVRVPDKNDDFYEVASLFLADTPHLLQRIGAEGYQVQDIQKIVEEYNALKRKK